MGGFGDERLGGYLRTATVKPLWTAFWLDSVDLHTGLTVILYGYLLSAIFAAVVPSWRVARIAYLVGYLSFLGFVNEFG